MEIPGVSQNPAEFHNCPVSVGADAPSSAVEFLDFPVGEERGGQASPDEIGGQRPIIAGGDRYDVGIPEYPAGFQELVPVFRRRRRIQTRFHEKLFVVVPAHPLHGEGQSLQGAVGRPAGLQ